MLEKKKRYSDDRWAREWVKMFETFGWGPELAKGKAHSRTKNICELKVSAGTIQADLEESEQHVYHVVIKVYILPPDQWNELLNILADNAIFMAKLLIGEIPEEIDDIFHKAGISLFPKSYGSFQVYCTCDEAGDFCKHVAAVAYEFKAKLQEDPLSLLCLRGMDKKELFEALRERRSILVEEYNDRAKEFAKEEKPHELTQNNSIENFWIGGMNKDIPTIRINSPETGDLIFNRLGEPDFFEGKRDMIRQLRRDYERVLSKALTAGYLEIEE